MVHRRYRAFGLELRSAIALPELVPSEGGFDVEVVLTRVEPELGGVRLREALFQAAPDRLQVGVPGIARYLAEGGVRLAVDPAEGAPPEDVRSYLLGAMMGALLYQRGRFPLHGSALAREGRAVVVVGASGSGKSTLSGTFLRHGWELVADDLCVLDPALDPVTAEPGFPRLRLWPDSAERLGHGGELPRFRTVRPKRVVPADPFADAPRPVGCVCELVPGEGRLRFEAVENRAERCRVLLDHSYRRRYAAGMGLSVVHLAQVASLAERLPVFRVHLPRGAESLADLGRRLAEVVG